MSKRETKSHTVTARLSPSVAKRLATCSKLLGRTRSFMVEYIIDRYIDEQIEEAEMLVEGAADEKAGRLIPHEEAMRQIQQYIASRKRQRRKAA